MNSTSTSASLSSDHPGYGVSHYQELIDGNRGVDEALKFQIIEQWPPTTSVATLS
jgi:hypothetical protein